jgi:hypothetical protein
VNNRESTDSLDGILRNPLLLRLAVGYVRANREQLDKQTLRKRLLDAGLDASTIDLLLDDEKSVDLRWHKQPDPEPPALSQQAPSLLLYLTLVIIASALIVIAFNIQEPNWSSLIVNVATEIIGSVIILILVDRRLRSSELKAIREYAETSSVRFVSLFSPEIRDAVSYAKALNVELERIRPKPYFERDELEGLVEKHPSGFLLYGDPGCGKTTLLQSIALRQTKKAIQQSRDGRIPIFFPSRYLKNGDIDIVEQLWRQASRFSKLKRKRFYQWLSQGKLLIIFDGLDEVEPRKVSEILTGIRGLKEAYPKTSVIASCRTYFLSRVTQYLDFQTVEMSDLSQDEATEFIRLLLTE